MNFETWFKNQRNDFEVELCEILQKISILEQAEKGTLCFSYLNIEERINA